MKCRLKSMLTTVTTFALSAMLLAGCGADAPAVIESAAGPLAVESSGENMTETPSETVTEPVTMETEVEATTEETSTETETEIPSTMETEMPSTTEAPTTVAPTMETTTEAPKPTEKPTEKATEKQTEKPTNAPEPTTTPEEYTTSYWAMQEDAPAIAAKVIEYINEYRVKEGTFELVQGTKEMQAFADLRSRQLVKNFDHDYDDTLAAVKQLNYGEFWSDGWVQAFSESTEAILLSFTSGTIDEMATSIADDFHGSPRHWSYLGNVEHRYEELKYVAVGLTYSKGFWFCAIWMDSEQHTGPVYFD